MFLPSGIPQKHWSVHSNKISKKKLWEENSRIWNDKLLYENWLLRCELCCWWSCLMMCYLYDKATFYCCLTAFLGLGLCVCLGLLCLPGFGDVLGVFDLGGDFSEIETKTRLIPNWCQSKLITYAKHAKFLVATIRSQWSCRWWYQSQWSSWQQNACACQKNPTGIVDQ